jgi:signal transduction histidine kinase/DNA-binding NtrC family response regulator
MDESLRVLLVEDSKNDATLILRRLARAGYRVQSERVEDADAMRAALSRTWDVIIADHQMARFNAPGALRILHEAGLDIPFILVSGSIGEELAAAMMKSGAHDYILKNNLARLAPAIEREVREARSRYGRRQAEKELAESQERLALAIEATQLGTFDFSPVTGKLIWSEVTNRHFGLPPGAEVNFETFVDGLHPDDRERVQDTVQNLRPGGDGKFAMEYRAVGIQDRVERWLSCWGRAFFDAEGKPVRFVGTTLDISGRRHLEDQFRQAQKLESVARLAGGVAHDFNNLLTVINGYGDMLLQKLRPGDPLYDLCSEIRIAGERAAALSGQLLVLSRKQVIQAKEVNLNDVIAEVEKMLGRLIGEDIQLKSILSPALGKVFADSGQIHQILMNLAINARDAMPLGGKLLIETGNIDLDDSFAEHHAEVKPGPYVQLKVSDTGAGMTKEVMAHLFEPFFTTKKAGQGTGLGLATVYGIVKQCGGSIWVYSEPGQGTSFKIYLPRIGSTETPRKALTAAARALRGWETILVVEDQDQLRKMAVRVLRSHGYKVHEAANPEEALLNSQRYKGPIHLLLTDVVMPGMSGRELADRLKPLRPDMEIICMSGYSEHAMLDRQMLNSAAYLAKPFSPEELAVKVRELLGPLRPAGTIVVTGSQPDVRRHLSGVLAEAGYLVLEARSVTEVIEQIEASDVDLLIADLAALEREGAQTIRTLRQERPRLKIIALSGDFAGSPIPAAEALGAHAALANPIQPDDLLESVARLMAG